MGDQIIITEEDDRPKAPDIIVIKPESVAKTEKVVIEKTVVTETKRED